MVLCSQPFPRTQKGGEIPERKRLGVGLLNHCCFLGTQAQEKFNIVKPKTLASLKSSRGPLSPFLLKKYLYLQFHIFSQYKFVLLDFFFSFSFLAAQWHMEFPGWDQIQAAVMLDPLTHCAGQVLNLHPGAAKKLPIPLHHRWNSVLLFTNFSFIFIFCLFRALPLAYGSSQSRD